MSPPGLKTQQRYNGTLTLIINGLTVHSEKYTYPKHRTRIFAKYQQFAKGKPNAEIILKIND
jgi:hypothetical protein